MLVPCPTPNVQHTGRSQGYWTQEVLLMLMGAGAQGVGWGAESVSNA